MAEEYKVVVKERVAQEVSIVLRYGDCVKMLERAIKEALEVKDNGGLVVDRVDVYGLDVYVQVWFKEKDGEDSIAFTDKVHMAISRR